jgi:hypothetical protein
MTKKESTCSVHLEDERRGRNAEIDAIADALQRLARVQEDFGVQQNLTREFDLRQFDSEQ